MRDGPFSLEYDRTIDTGGAKTLQLTAVARQIGWTRRDIDRFSHLRLRGTLVSRHRELLHVARLEVNRHGDRLDVEVEVPNDERHNLVAVDLFFEGIGAPGALEPEILTRFEVRREWMRVSGPPPAELPPPPILPSRSPLDILRAQEEVQREAKWLSERHAEWNRRVLEQLEKEAEPSL